MKNDQLVMWLDRGGVVHAGVEPEYEDDGTRTLCGDFRVATLHRAIGYQAPTCLKCANR